MQAADVPLAPVITIRPTVRATYCRGVDLFHPRSLSGLRANTHVR